MLIPIGVAASLSVVALALSIVVAIIFITWMIVGSGNQRWPVAASIVLLTISAALWTVLLVAGVSIAVWMVVLVFDLLAAVFIYALIRPPLQKRRN